MVEIPEGASYFFFNIAGVCFLIDGKPELSQHANSVIVENYKRIYWTERFPEVPKIFKTGYFEFTRTEADCTCEYVSLLDGTREPIDNISQYFKP